MKAARVHRCNITPMMLTTMLEQARNELDAGQPGRARQYVQAALSRLQDARTEQDQVLDATTLQPEARAVKVTEPLYSDPRDEH